MTKQTENLIKTAKKSYKKIGQKETKYSGLAKKADKRIKRIILKEGTKRPAMATLKAQAVVSLLDKKLTRQYQRDLKAVVKESIKYLKIQNINLTKKDKAILAKKIGELIREIKDPTVRYKREISKLLSQNLGRKQSLSQLAMKTGRLYPAFVRHIPTISITGMQRLYKDTNFAKESEDNEFFQYVGPMDGVTRPQCRAYLEEKVFSGVSAADVQSEIMTFYNCRHQLVPITESEYRALKG